MIGGQYNEQNDPQGPHIDAGGRRRKEEGGEEEEGEENSDVCVSNSTQHTNTQTHSTQV
jgi:hypothetical protein